jgi:hypothetical protein
MTPAEFVTEIVLPTVHEFRDSPRSRRHAYLACYVAYHTKDQLTEAGCQDVVANIRAAASPHFDVVADVCTGTKHPGRRGGFRVGKDWDRPPALWGVAQFGISRWGDARGGREIRHGSEGVDLYESVKQVLLAYAAAYPAALKGCDLSSL